MDKSFFPHSRGFWGLSIFGIIVFSVCIVSLLYCNLLSVPLVVTIHFFIYISLIFIDFLNSGRFTLFQVWVAAFIFIILSEMIELAYTEPLVIEYVDAISFLLIANDVVLLGYIFTHPGNNVTPPPNEYIVEKKNSFLLIILLMEVLYLSINAYVLVNAFSGGVARASDAGTSLGNFDALSTFTDGVGLLLPALIAYYFKYCSKRSSYWGVVWAIPVVMVHIFLGTRAKLLFAILPFFIILGVTNFGKTSLKKNVRALVVILLLGFLSGFIKAYRATSLVDVFVSGNFSIDDSSDDAPLLLSLTGKMSPEGVVYMTKVSDDYFTTHPHQYGVNSGYILYFWIPRALWENKPTMLDHWLIREVEDVSDAFSSASGFSGELKADFGSFSLFFIWFFGLYLKKADVYIKNIFSDEKQNFSMIIASAIVPYIFFFVRSPLTSSFSFIFEIVLCFLMRKYLCKNKVNAIV